MANCVDKIHERIQSYLRGKSKVLDDAQMKVNQQTETVKETFADLVSNNK